MEKPTPKPTPNPEHAALAAKLEQELIGLRDTLVTLSLCLKDWQFEVDQTRRKTAQQEVLKTLEKCRLGGTPCDRKGES